MTPAPARCWSHSPLGSNTGRATWLRVRLSSHSQAAANRRTRSTDCRSSSTMLTKRRGFDHGAGNISSCSGWSSEETARHSLSTNGITFPPPACSSRGDSSGTHGPNIVRAASLVTSSLPQPPSRRTCVHTLPAGSGTSSSHRSTLVRSSVPVMIDCAQDVRG